MQGGWLPRIGFVVLGIAMLVVGVAISINGRGSAEKYADLVDALVPPMPWQRSKNPDDQFKSLLRQQRIIFAFTAILGLGILIAALLSWIRGSV